MKKFILLIAVISACSMLPSCSSDDAEDDSNKSITLRNHTESGCKDISSASNTSQFDGQALRTQKYMDSTERVSLKGNSKGTLNVFRFWEYDCSLRGCTAIDQLHMPLRPHVGSRPS